MKNVLDVLKERGYLKQIVYEEELYKLLDSEKVTFYTGYDPTADLSLIQSELPTTMTCR